MKLVQRALIASIFSALLIFAAGCGSGDKKSKVTGIVTYKNEPVKGGNIYLTNDAGGSFSSPIEMNGAYTITDIVPGTYSVTVDTESVNPDRNAIAATPTRSNPNTPNAPGSAGKKDAMNKEYADKMGKGSSAGSDAGSGGGFGAPSKEELLKRYTKIPGKYGSKLTSGLTFEVGNGTTTKDFPLAD
jgi:hypothetical protein